MNQPRLICLEDKRKSAWSDGPMKAALVEVLKMVDEKRAKFQIKMSVAIGIGDLSLIFMYLLVLCNPTTIIPTC